MLEFLGFISYLITLYTYIVIAVVIVSWLMAFGVINAYNPMVRSIWQGLNAVTEPLLAPIRNAMPNMGGIDISPVILLLACYFLMCFYLYSVDKPAARRRARTELVVVALVAVVITVAAVTVPLGALSGPSRTMDMTIPQVAVFYLCAGLYMTYAIGMAGRWSAGYARKSERPHATGLWITAIGLGLLAVACGVRAAFTIVRWSGGILAAGREHQSGG